MKTQELRFKDVNFLKTFKVENLSESFQIIKAQSSSHLHKLSEASGFEFNEQNLILRVVNHFTSTSNQWLQLALASRANVD